MFFADTAKRGDGDNASDEESLPAKRQKKDQTRRNRPALTHDGGQQFQIKMAAVIGLRGMKEGHDFEMETNVKYAGRFHHLVYTWRCPEVPENPITSTERRRYFVQFKHTDNPKRTKLTPAYLGKLLHKTFESYCNIIHDPKFEDIPLESTEFIIYTNKQLGQKLKIHNWRRRHVDPIFKTCHGVKISLNFTPDLKKENDVYTRVERLVKESGGFIELSGPAQKSKLYMIREFLNKLIMVIGQKGHSELDDVIINAIRELDDAETDSEPEIIKLIDPKNYLKELLYFKRSLEDWWRNKKGTMKQERLRGWLQKAKNNACLFYFKTILKSYTKKLYGAP
jgi:hypothetical protein